MALPMFENFFRSQSAEPLEFLGKSDTVRRLQGLIDEARQHVTLISPYVSIEKLRDVERKLRQALDRGVEVTLVMRAEDEHTRGPSRQGLELLDSLNKAGMRLVHVRDLHAKVYYSERNALITSLNLIESSFNNSIEIGVWVPASRSEYSQIIGFVTHEIEPHGQEQGARRPARSRRQSSPPAPRQPPHGFCIRCHETIDFDVARPYCDRDFATWSRYKDPHYEDNHCHHCGADFGATKSKPLCRKCFGALRQLLDT